jgi:hypothetical protein
MITMQRYHGGIVVRAVLPCGRGGDRITSLLRNIRPTISLAPSKVDTDSGLRREQVRASTKDAELDGTDPDSDTAAETEQNS